MNVQSEIIARLDELAYRLRKLEAATAFRGSGGGISTGQGLDAILTDDTGNVLLDDNGNVLTE